MNQNFFKTSTLLLAFIVYIYSSHAGTSTATLNVSTNIPPACTISANNLAFGPYSGVALYSVGSVNAYCTAGTTFTVTLDGGGNYASSTRQMTDGSGNYIPYSITSDSAGTVPITNGGTAAAGTGDGSTILATPIYGQIAGSLVVPAGFYNDNVTVTITFP